jgi:predicted P-loop ATPase/GTPase
LFKFTGCGSDRFDIKQPVYPALHLTSLAGIIRFNTMVPEKDTMEFSNLDRVCLNLLAYQWIHVRPPGTMAVDQITDCFADIPKEHVHKALAALYKKGFILLESRGKSASLTPKGFDRIRSAVAEPVCAALRSGSPFKARRF